MARGLSFWDDQVRSSMYRYRFEVGLAVVGF